MTAAKTSERAAVAFPDDLRPEQMNGWTRDRFRARKPFLSVRRSAPLYDHENDRAVGVER